MLNLHDRMTECHEVCDDSAFMPTKEFPLRIDISQSSISTKIPVGSEYAKNR